MNLRHIVLESLRFHSRTHLGVVLGTAVGSAALIGALMVGDSVRESLKDRARMRLGGVEVALNARDRLVTTNLARRWAELAGAPAEPRAASKPPIGSILHLRGTVSRQDAMARAHNVQIYGADASFWTMSPEATASVRNRTEDPSIPTAAPTEPGNGRVLINSALARQLEAKAGDIVILRFAKPAALSQDAVLSPRQDASAALRLEVTRVLSAGGFGDFDLLSAQRPALNAFVDPGELWKASGISNRVNLLAAPAIDRISGRAAADSAGSALEVLQPPLERAWTLEDAQLEVRVLQPDPSLTGGDAMPAMVEIASPRIFLGEPVVAVGMQLHPAASGEDRGTPPPDVSNGLRVITYLANAIMTGNRLTPYSMVTAAGPPWTPADLRDDEIVVTDWLASDLGVRPGDRVELVYFDPEAGARLIERTNAFTIRSVVPLRGLHADRTLMPDFPGLANAEQTRDWDAGFPLVHPIRDQDEKYWDEHRGTPKAYVSLNAGTAMWGNRFGNATAVRYLVPPGLTPAALQQAIAANLRAGLRATDVGLVLQPVRELAMKAATSGQDFGQLFLGFSLFLVVAAMLLVALLFQFGLEQRLGEVGTLLALGFRPRTVRALFLGEAAVLAVLGAVVGIAGGWLYAWLMIRGLTTVWSDAVAGTSLAFHVTLTSIFIGLAASVVVAVLTLGWTLRRVARRPARELLTGEIAPPRRTRRSRGLWIGAISGAAALGMVGWAAASGETADAETFFSAGSLLLIAGLALAAAWLGRFARRRTSAAAGDTSHEPALTPSLSRPKGGAHAAWVSTTTFTPTELAIRGTTRRRSRSLSTAALLACGTFLIASLGAFRMDAQRDAWRRSSGTGGFGLIGESSLPISQDLDTTAGLAFFGLSTHELPGVRFVPFRVREGDDASCLNLSRAQRPRILGVDPDLLARRDAFTFASIADELEVTNGWKALEAAPKALAAMAPIGPSSTATNAASPIVPAIGDAASIQWALGKKIGDDLELTDERGQPFRLRLVGAVANSILQGSLIIDEARFRRLFPGTTGYRFFLIDTPTNAVTKASETLSRALADQGMELTPATRRLAEFNAVQNTYLTTFQILGGLGLILGSAGLGVVVLRNVLERRGELALMTALGYPRRLISRLVLLEHTALLILGLAIGLVSAALAIIPSLLAPTVDLPFLSLGLTLAAVVLLGLLTTWLATRSSLRGQLVSALRGE